MERDRVTRRPSNEDRTRGIQRTTFHAKEDEETPCRRLVNSASAVELVHSNSDIIGVVPYVGTTNICPDIALPRPGQPGSPGDFTVLGTTVGSIRRSQRLASRPLVSYSPGNAHARGASDYEAETGIRTRDAVALPTSLFALRPRPSSSVAGNLREDLPDRGWGATEIQMSHFPTFCPMLTIYSSLFVAVYFCYSINVHKLTVDVLKCG